MLTAAQMLPLNHPASALVVGPPGSGKTLLLVHKAAQLTAKGQTVALSTFAFRGLEFLRHFAQGHYPQLTAHVATGLLKAGTVVELAQAQLATTGTVNFASNNQVREILRSLILTQGFTGTLPEAEHIIRNAKGRAKKMPENDKHYPLLTAYQAKLEEFGLLDRYDIIRKHILGMKNATVPPLQVKHILLDNLEDANEIQLIWLQIHQNQGIQLTL
ncbi:MAG: hypothetical protein EBR79_01995, partial [Proteobacteria bacterium]|nr:hypothetical protein [Pseudomonadota bacterium]